MENEDAPPTTNPEQKVPEENEIIEKPDKTSDKAKEENQAKTEEAKEEEEEKEEEVKGEKYPKSLFGQFEFDLYDDCLKPDCTFILDDRTYYVYFNLKSLSNKLEVDIANLFKTYPKNLENLKEPLEKYMEEYQKEEFKEQSLNIGYIIERIKFIFGEESYNRKVQERVMKMAFLFCQIKSETIRINDLNKKITIGIIDSYDYKIKIYSYEDFQKINDEINNIDVKINNINEIDNSLQVIEKKMQILIDEVKDKYKGSDEVNQAIFILYLLNRIDDKLSKVEDSNDVKGNYKTYKKMRNIRSQMNKYIKNNIKKEQKKLFFDLDLLFKIIKNTNTEKKILLDGVNIETFLNTINENFENLQVQLFKFDKDDLNGATDTGYNKLKIIEFLKEKMEKLEKLDGLEQEIDKDINNINLKTYEQVCEGGKNAKNAFFSFRDNNYDDAIENAKNAGKTYYQVKENNIIKAYKEKTKSIIKYNKEETIKLIKEYELIYNFEKQRKKVKDESKINGYLISRKIKDINNPILDLYSVDIVY